MYSHGQTVECCDKYGRVLYHDRQRHLVHVLFKINSCTWKIEKYDEIFCVPSDVFLWTIENAFNTKYVSKPRTPQFQHVRVSDDHIIML